MPIDEHPPGSGSPQPKRVTSNNGAAQLATVREYAVRVFGKDAAAAAWLGQLNRSVLGGRCTVAEACLTTEGFLAAMLELARLNMKAAPATPLVPPPELLEGDGSAAANDPDSRRF